MSLYMAERAAAKSDRLLPSQSGKAAGLGRRTLKEVSDSTNQSVDTMEPADSVCTCGPCQRFWRDVLKNSYGAQAKEEGTLAPNTLGKVRHLQTQLSVGDRVTVQGKPGCVKFVDFVDDIFVAPVLRVGIRLEESIPEGHDGVYLGKRYFYCTKGHGIFERVTEVVLVAPANPRPPVRGNTMFPSWSDVCSKRKEQEALLWVQQERQRKAAAKRSHQLTTKTSVKPPSISPRQNRAHHLRRDMVCLGKVPGAHLTSLKDDPSDVAFKDQQQKQSGRKKKKVLVATLSKPPDVKTLDRTLRRQWCEKYQDPEKVGRMQQTLTRLRGAYQEGKKLRQLYIN